MINCNRGEIQLGGDSKELRADIIVLLRALLREGIIKDPEDLATICAMSLLTPNELHELIESFKEKKDSDGKFFDVFGDLL